MLAALVIGLASGAQAQSIGEVEQKWRAWMVRNNRTSGGIAVLQDGKPALEATMGGLKPGAPVRLASLSKAITAVCVARLVERGSLGFDTTVGRALAGTLARLGPPADKRLVDVTIGELLVHRSGLGRSGGDPTTSTALADYLRRNPATDTAFDAQLRWTLRFALSSPPGERFAYSNANYLLLGAAIEEATGQAYETFCRKHVLVPLGAASSARLDPAHRFMASYGGWSMKLQDYARFYQAFADGNSAIGPKARAWMMSPEAKSLGGGAHYGLGTFVRPTAKGGANFWHWGDWKYTLLDAYGGPITDSWMTYAVRIGAANANATVYFEPKQEEGAAQRDLDHELAQALAALRR
ncbi:MAG TPA: serine hydrolase domain-containing protein [Reyranella sp.]|jgi:CubicO group peptidase (beta-lactamase class C family)|nr:serine hydrolase domain-containing protein [Reyranella sp.]